MQQLDLFATVRAPAIFSPVIADGGVVLGDIDETIVLPHARMAWDVATIELHRHIDGRWMWATGWNCENEGSGYRVGPKWGKFAESRDDALHYAKDELRRRLSSKGAAAKPILTWLETLQ